LALRKSEAALSQPDTPLDVSAPDNDTILMRRGPWLLITRLRNAGSLTVPDARWQLVLTSEDDTFSVEGRAPAIHLSNHRVIFQGPTAVLLREQS
jgi:hypothetical protein